MKQTALTCANHGWRVFPLQPGTKVPFPGSHGFKDASADQAAVANMRWEIDGQPCNLATATGNGCTVVDVDVKHGKDGFASLEKAGLTRAALDDLCPFKVVTPSGGMHYYFRSSRPVKSRTNILPGVDTRGQDGYAVLPPSIYGGKPYRVLGQAADAPVEVPDLSALPPWETIERFLPKLDNDATPSNPAPNTGQPPPPEVLERARKYLSAIPASISGQGGHDTALKTASALVNGFELPPQTALQLLLENWNSRCQPPWSAKELRHKVEEAARLGPPQGKAKGWLLSADGRSATSPANGAKGGRPTIDYAFFAQQYKAFYKTDVLWGKAGGFKEYDPLLGAYRLRTEKEMAARAGAFLCSGFCSGMHYSKNAEANVVAALRATPTPELAPPLFLSSGKSARGWISMRNGLLDVEAAARGEEVQLLPHTPDFFSYRTLPYDWLPDAPCPRFTQFLREVQPDEEGREMLQLLAGLLLVEEVGFQVFFILIGEGGTGKSTFLAILKAMLGPENTCSIPLYRFAEKHLTIKLASALTNLVDEAPNADLSRWGSLAASESILKSVVSGGDVHVEPKGVDADDRPATARCVFCQNPPLPPFSDRTNGIWRRLRVIPFPVVVDGTANEVNNLADIIAATELPGIFAWAVKGLGKLRQLTEFPQCKAGAAMIEENRAMLDKEGAFLRENYKFSPDAFTVSADINTLYSEWCKEEKYPSPKGPQAFAADIKRIFPGVRYHSKNIDGKKKRGWLNLARSGFYFDFCKRLVMPQH